MANETVKLSTLPRNITLVNDEGNIMIASRLVDEITHFDEKHHLDRKWMVAEKLEIGCNVEEMIERHIEDVVTDAEIEDGEDLQKKILKAINPWVDAIQGILDEALKDTDTTYWLGTNQQVEIDVVPAEIGQEG